MNYVVDIIDALAAPAAWVAITVIVMRGLPSVISGIAGDQDIKKIKGGPGGGEVELYPSSSQPDPPKKYNQIGDRPVASRPQEQETVYVRPDDE